MTVFVCVAALAILDRLDLVDVETLAWWLSERQLPNGGLNGRPEKLEDVSFYALIGVYKILRDLLMQRSHYCCRFVIHGGISRHCPFWANSTGSTRISSPNSS